jgi:hypothetical protein
MKVSTRAPAILDINGHDICMTEELKFTDILVEAPNLVPVENALVHVETQTANSPASAPLAVPNDTTKTLLVRAVVGFLIGALNVLFFLSGGAAWLFAFRKLFLFFHAHTGLKGDLQLFQAIWMTPLVANAYWGEALLFIILLSCTWTTLHVIGNKPLTWMRWPFLALVWIGSAVWFPAGNCAYALVFCLPDAMFAAVELANRAMNFALKKLFGEIDDNIRTEDKAAATWVLIVLLSTPLLAMMVLQHPIMVGIALASAVLQALHMYWNRRVTQCILDESKMEWRSANVMMLDDRRHPEIQVELATKSEDFRVRHGTAMPPLEVMQFEVRKKRVVAVGFDKISNRPVAIKLGGRVFPLTKSFIRLP